VSARKGRASALRTRRALALCLPVGAVGAMDGWECTVLAHVTGSGDDGAGMRVRWHRSGSVSYVRPGRLVLVSGAS